MDNGIPDDGRGIRVFDGQRIPFDGLEMPTLILQPTLVKKLGVTWLRRPRPSLVDVAAPAGVKTSTG